MVYKRILYVDQGDKKKLGKTSNVKILNIRIPKKFAVITLKFEQDSFTEE